MLVIIMLIIGIIGLIKGRISVTKTKEIRRPASIFISLIFLAPLPLQILVGVIMGAKAVADGQQDLKELESSANMIGLVIVGVCFLAALVLSFVLAKPKEPVARKRRDEDYDDYEDRPRRKNSRDYDDDEDDRPRRKDDYDDRG